MDDKIKNKIKKLLLEGIKEKHNRDIYVKLLIIMIKNGLSIHDIEEIRDELIKEYQDNEK